jgi:hypothetical protein
MKHWTIGDAELRRQVGLQSETAKFPRWVLNGVQSE